MKMTFIRHGETDLNKEKKMTGQTDVSLNEEGWKQADKIVQELSGDFDVMYSSSLKRAVETASVVNKKLNIPFIIDDRILERNFGTLVGKTWEEINVKVGFDARERDKEQKYDYVPFGGESAEQVRARLMSFLDMVKKTRYKKPLIVCHGGIIRMLYVISGKDFDHIKNASVCEFEL